MAETITKSIAIIGHLHKQLYSEYEVLKQVIIVSKY